MSPLPTHPLRLATAQFENRSGDKAYNLARIAALAHEARAAGAQAIAFHECCVTGYTFARSLTRDQLWDIAEPIPSGPSLDHLRRIANDSDIAVLAGLFERGDDGEIYKAYVCVTRDGVIASHRKLHPFIHPAIRPGNRYTVFDLHGWRCGILICYDNNVIENVRATRLLGAQVLFAPHVTMGTPSTRPGAGFYDEKLWADRHANPGALRAEFDGLKGRAWLMKWLPARAYDNALYLVFSNPVGMDGDQLKNGGSLVLDPYGDILAECRRFDDQFVVATIDPAALQRAGGRRYLEARRPDLYRDLLGAPHHSRQQIAWLSQPPAST